MCEEDGGRGGWVVIDEALLNLPQRFQRGRSRAAGTQCSATYAVDLTWWRRLAREIVL